MAYWLVLSNCSRGRKGSAAPAAATAQQAGRQAAYVVSAGASPAIKKLEGGRREQGVSSTRVTDPTPASTMFLATCGGEQEAEAAAGCGLRLRRGQLLWPGGPPAVLTSAARPVHPAMSTLAPLNLRADREAGGGRLIATAGRAGSSAATVLVEQRSPRLLLLHTLPAGPINHHPRCPQPRSPLLRLHPPHTELAVVDGGLMLRQLVVRHGC